MTKEFAPEFETNEYGWKLFPPDANYRRELFPNLDLTAHPAKANIYLVQEIVKYVSSVGDTVMDIMGGTGTLMVAALLGRNVICMDIEEAYCELMRNNLESLESYAPGISWAVNIIEGDSAKLLPLPIAQHIIFSPPYAGILKVKSLGDGDENIMVRESYGEGFLQYSKHPENIGNLNEFLYHQKMEKVYKKCYESLPQDGTLTIIIKDHISKGERVYLGERAKRDCLRAGFVLDSHWKWKAPGTSFLAIKKYRGDPTVEDEDIIILRRTEPNASNLLRPRTTD